MVPDPSSGQISVGGPGGIQISGGMVHVNGVPQQQPRGAMQVSLDPSLGRVPGLMRQNPGTAAAMLAFAGLLVLVGPAVFISVLQLPWLVFAVPALIGSGLFITSGVMFARSRKYLPTGGLDAATEQRLLDVAVQYHGRVTVTAAARALQMPLSEADAALTALARAGHATVENDPKTGVIVYVFPEIEAGLLIPGNPDAGSRRLL